MTEHIRSRDCLIAFFVGNIGSFRLQRYLIKHCKRQGREAVVIYNGAKDAVFEVLELEAAHLDIRCIASDDYLGGMQDLETPKVKGLPLRTRILSAFPLHRWICRHWHQVVLSLNAFKLLNAVSPCALVVSEDGVSTSQFILSAAKSMAIPIIDVPYGNATRQDFDIDIARKLSEGTKHRPEGVVGWLLRKIAPQWIKTGKHAGQLMFSQIYILKLELLGISIRDPWIVHGGPADRLCAESPIALEQYVGEGIPHEKISLTGSPYSDRVREGLTDDKDAADAFLKGRFIVPDRPRILVSWPASYHSTFPSRSEYPTYEEMTADILNFINKLENCDVTISMHPAADPKVFELLGRIGIFPSTDDLIKLLPCNDIFITYFSSSIRWALGAGKVVLNYDAYRIGLKNYSDAPGFINMAKSAELKHKLIELVTNEKKFALLAGAQAADAANWSLSDGKCNDRILAEIDLLFNARAGRL